VKAREKNARKILIYRMFDKDGPTLESR